MKIGIPNNIYLNEGLVFVKWFSRYRRSNILCPDESEFVTDESEKEIKMKNFM